MKKIISMMLALCLFCSIGFSFAESINLDGIVDDNLSNVNIIQDTKDLNAVRGVSSTDTVSVNGTVVTVTTANGLRISYDRPADVLTLTQNYLMDISLYNRFYSDPASQIQSYIDREMHLNIFRCSENLSYDAYLYVYEGDSLGGVIGNAYELSEADATSVASYLESQLGTAFIFGTLGDHVWFLGNDVAENQRCWLATWVDGCMILVYIRANSEQEASAALDDMAFLSITRQK